MSADHFQQAKSWVTLIDDAVKLCFDERERIEDTEFFASVSQALKAKLDHSGQKGIVDGENVLEDLVRPFLQETSYAFDIKKEVPSDEEGRRGKKLKTVWEHGGYRSVKPVYSSLQDAIEQFPEINGLQSLSDRIEELTKQLPLELKSDSDLQGALAGILDLSELDQDEERPEPVS